MGNWCKIPPCLDSHHSNYTHTHTSPFLPCHKSSCLTMGQISYTLCASGLLSKRRNELHYAIIGVLIALCIGDCQTLNITLSKIILVIRWALCFWLMPPWQNVVHYIRSNKLLLPQSRANKCSNSSRNAGLDPAKSLSTLTVLWGIL